MSIIRGVVDVAKRSRVPWIDDNEWNSFDFMQSDLRLEQAAHVRITSVSLDVIPWKHHRSLSPHSSLNSIECAAYVRHEHEPLLWPWTSHRDRLFHPDPHSSLPCRWVCLWMADLHLRISWHWPLETNIAQIIAAKRSNSSHHSMLALASLRPLSTAMPGQEQFRPFSYSLQATLNESKSSSEKMKWKLIRDFFFLFSVESTEAICKEGEINEGCLKWNDEGASEHGRRTHTSTKKKRKITRRTPNG